MTELEFERLKVEIMKSAIIICVDAFCIGMLLGVLIGVLAGYIVGSQ